jgi:tRNA(fMet)-specific endonuclease VapC
MNARYLLDTNICIAILRQRPSGIVAKIRAKKPEEIALSSITLAELEYGVVRSQYPERNRIALFEFLTSFAILDFDAGAAAHYGTIRASLESRGTPIGPMDLLIASQAMSNNLTLVTGNVREFKRVNGLSVENWLG